MEYGIRQVQVFRFTEQLLIKWWTCFGFLHLMVHRNKQTNKNPHTHKNTKKPDITACTYRPESLLKKYYGVMQLICCGAKL